jgi:hypothetical protein
MTRSRAKQIIGWENCMAHYSRGCEASSLVEYSSRTGNRRRKAVSLLPTVVFSPDASNELFVYNNEPINCFWRAEIHRPVSSKECRQIGVATKNHEAQHYEPEKRSVDGLPKRLLYGRHACQAASDQRTRRADGQELSQRGTIGLGVHPRNNHAHPHHGRL